MDSWQPSTGWSFPVGSISGSLGTGEQLRPSSQGPPFPRLPTPEGFAQYLFSPGQASNSPPGHQTRPLFPPQRGVQLPYEVIGMAPPGHLQSAPCAAQRDMPKTTRKPRSTAPLEEEWDRNKHLIEDLYMVQKLPLIQTMETMREQHKFNATDKMYKQRFKVWKWSKYLPKKEAGWMMNKVNQRQPRGTEFQYGGQKWTEERIRRTFDRLAATNEMQIDEEAALDGPTPAGLTYGTPSQLPDTPRPFAASSQPQLRDPSPPACPPPAPPAATSTNIFIDRLLRGSHRQENLSLQDLDKLVVYALRADSKGEDAVAQDKFLDAIVGFKETLSSTDERTMRASYLLAASFANQQQMDRADEVLDWLTSGIVERWGRRHRNALAHFVVVADLLRSWNRHANAMVFVCTALGSGDEIDDAKPLNIPSENTERAALGSQEDLTGAPAKIFAESSDPGEVDRQLQVAKLWSSANVDGISDILRRLIAQCDEYPEALVVQAVQARCTLAQRHLSQGQRKEARSVLKQAWLSLERLLRKQDKVAKKVLELSCPLAFLYLQAGRQETCATILERAANIAERQVTIIPTRSAADPAVEFHIAIGLKYQKLSSWSQARPWFERALALVIQVQGPYHADAQKLAKSLEERRYRLTPLDSVVDQLSR